MGERKGQNKYYPPDFDYRKHRSLDAYHGTHPLRERAKKLDQGILVIRFEMPYNIWCDGCGNHIGMGVRYNAEKSKIGNYYTTPIYKFRMKCHLCPNYIEIKTDPAAHDYVIITGARRKEQRWDPKENEQIVTEDKSVQKKMALDAMFRLEHSVEDKVKMMTAKPGVAKLTERQQGMKDDYLLNKYARDKFRNEKKMMQASADEDNALLKKSSLDIELVAEDSQDVKVAKLFKYRTVASFDEKQKEKRQDIKNRPLFAATWTSANTSQRSAERQQRLQKLAERLRPNHGTRTFDLNNQTGASSMSRPVVQPKKEAEQTDSQPSVSQHHTKDTVQSENSLDCFSAPLSGPCSEISGSTSNCMEGVCTESSLSDPINSGPSVLSLLGQAYGTSDSSTDDENNT